MRQKILLILFASIAASINMHAQTTSKEITDSAYYKVVDQVPLFPGGNKVMDFYISHNLNYPQYAIENDIEGIVNVSFIIDTIGEIKGVKIIHGIGWGCDEEAVKVIKNMPRWIPGKLKGKTVNVLSKTEVKFTLYHHIKNIGYSQSGSNALKEGKYDLALNFLNDAIKDNPKDIDSYYNRGICYFKLNDIENACESWLSAAKLGDKESLKVLQEKCTQSQIADQITNLKP
jgi:TonB family protein